MSVLTTFYRFLLRGGPTEKASIEVAKDRELLLDTTTKELRVGDGATPGGLPLTVGRPPADCVLESATRLGLVGNMPLTTTTLSAADWAALPVGWSGIISADVAVASGLPAADVYYLHKISSRDVSGGAAYQAIGYLTPALHVGVAATSADLPAWSKVALSASTVGHSLLSLSTPTAQKIPLINADGSVTLIDVPSGGEGTDAGIWADPCVQWWYDSDTGVQGLAGAPTTTGEAVYAWADRSAHGWSAVQDGTPPSWLASAINGRGAVRFASGKSQRLRASVRTYQAGLVGDFTVFALARRSSISGLAEIFGQSSSPRISLYSDSDSSGEYLRIVVGPSSIATATDFTPTTAWELLEVRYRGGTTSFFVNGALIQSVSAVLTHGVTSSEWSLYLGTYYGSQACDVDLAVCLCLDGSATDLFCATVRAWVLSFSGL